VTVEDASLPLYQAYLTYGHAVFGVCAAVNGCDFTQDERGVPGLGMVAVLRTFSDLLSSEDVSHGATLNLPVVAVVLLKNANHNIALTKEELHEQLNGIVNWYMFNAKFYEYDPSMKENRGRILAGITRHVLGYMDELSTDHVNGRNDPKTKRQFTSEEQKVLQNYVPANALHNNIAPTASVAASRPAGVEKLSDIKADDLKRMVSDHGGSLVDSKGNALTLGAVHGVWKESYTTMTCLTRL
jgi:hypothetical protein